MDADSSNRKLFYSLLNRQRREGRTSLDRLVVDDVHLTTDEANREELASYFEKLATPKDKDHYNTVYKQQVNFDFELICDICSKLHDSPPVVTEAEVEQIIKTLKNNKASDGCGLAAEHLNYGGGKMVELSRVS